MTERNLPPRSFHMPFLAAMSEGAKDTADPELVAGFLCLRMVERWYSIGPPLSEIEVNQLRGLLVEMGPTAPSRVALLRLVNSVQLLQVVEVGALVEPLFVYAQILEHCRRLDLAADVYEMVARFTHESDDGDTGVDALIRVGHCHRWLGNLDDAELAYIRGRKGANTARRFS